MSTCPQRTARASRTTSHLSGLAAALCLALVGVGCEVAVSGTLDPHADGTPVASFDEDRTQGVPGLVVRFTSTSQGNISSYAWDFGGAGTSTAANPQVTFPNIGSYTVSLTVTGPNGISTVEKTDLVQVGAAVTAGFSCSPLIGYAPLTVICTDASENADSWSWDFGDGGTSTEQNPTYTYTTGGTFDIQQTASGAGGVAIHPTPSDPPVQVEVAALQIVAEVCEHDPPQAPVCPAANQPAGAPPAPATVRFTATGSLGGLIAWAIDGVVLPGQTTSVIHTFNTPGTSRVRFQVGDFTPGGALGAVEIDYTVGYGPAVARFAPVPVGGTGPLDVVFMDLSGGQIDKWEWDFGDGEKCVHPDQSADPDHDGTPACIGGASAQHRYTAIGSYDVSLRVTGPGAAPGSPAVEDTFVVLDAVRVYMLGASFEEQTANAPIGLPWTQHPDSSTQHIVIAGAADHGMPTDGAKWAVIDGAGTDGQTPVLQVDNGISQPFVLPRTATVLEFDYALLFNEPPAALSADGVTATVSNGTTTVEIPSAVTDAAAPWAGQSSRFPTRDGSVVRVTPTRTASIDVAAAFGVTSPTTTPLAQYTLTIKVGNVGDGLRSPRAYVDNVRFVDPSSEPLVADFELSTTPVVVGRPTTFTDLSCVSAPVCPAPTSWRWDFGTSTLTMPPASSGSSDQSPTYVFPSAGPSTVTLTVRRGAAEDTISMPITVIDAPLAGFTVTDPPSEPYLAPATLTFTDVSTADVSDPIVAWSWDFGGWGSSTSETPAPVSILQAGPVTVTLTVTTQSGQQSTEQQTLTLQ